MFWKLGTFFFLSVLLLGCTQQATIPEPQPSFGATTAAVEIKNFSFIPSELVIFAGTTVTWKNNDSVLHKVVSTGNFSSQSMMTNESFSFKFDTVGVFDYFCEFHPSMKGKITVR